MMNILLTSVGRRSYLVNYFKDVIEDNGEVHVINSTPYSPAFKVADKATVAPLIYSSEYIPFLLDYCSKNEIKAIISCFDVDLAVLAKHKEAFKKIGTTVIVADYDIVTICEDKWKFYLFMRDNELNVPRTYISLDDAKKALANKIIEFPLIVKPRWGMGSISVYEACDVDELDILYKKAISNIKNSYLSYESAVDYGKSVLIQEKLMGQEYGLDVINDLNGNYISTCVKKKLAMRSGETDCAITVDCPELKIIGEQISALTKHPANMDVDIFESNGKFYVLEMNARFGGGYPFSHLAGVNEPKAIISWLKGEDVDANILSPKIGVMGQKDISIVEI